MRYSFIPDPHRSKERQEAHDQRIAKQNNFIMSLLLNVFLSVVSTILTLRAFGFI